MTLAPAQRRSARPSLRDAVRYDGPVSTLALGVFTHFLVSVQVWVCLVPAICYVMVVGWQPTHLAVWLAAAALLPTGPALFAAIASMRDFLDRGHVRGTMRRFWTAFATGTRRLAWWWATCAAMVVLVGYDLSLHGASSASLLRALAVTAALMVLSVALSERVLAGGRGTPVSMLVSVTAAVVRRPHLALVWVFVVVVAGAAMMIPVIGPSLALFSPAAAAIVIAVTDTALGFDPAPTDG